MSEILKIIYVEQWSQQTPVILDLLLHLKIYKIYSKTCKYKTKICSWLTRNIARVAYCTKSNYSNILSPSWRRLRKSEENSTSPRGKVRICMKKIKTFNFIISSFKMCKYQKSFFYRMYKNQKLEKSNKKKRLWTYLLI